MLSLTGEQLKSKIKGKLMASLVQGLVIDQPLRAAAAANGLELWLFKLELCLR